MERSSDSRYQGANKMSWKTAENGSLGQAKSDLNSFFGLMALLETLWLDSSSCQVSTFSF